MLVDESSNHAHMMSGRKNIRFDSIRFDSSLFDFSAAKKWQQPLRPAPPSSREPPPPARSRLSRTPSLNSSLSHPPPPSFLSPPPLLLLLPKLTLANDKPSRDESPYPPFEKHYHMVALELRGADKTAVFDFLRTDAGMLGEVLNRLVREDCLAADHSAAFLDRSGLT